MTTAVGLPEIAKRAGLSPCQCRKCGAHMGTDRALQALFERIVESCLAGIPVRVMGFGVFKAHTIKGRTFQTSVVEGGEASYPDTLVLKFSQSRKVKEAMNPRFQGEEEEEEDDDG